MYKRVRNSHIKGIAFSEIFVIVLAIFAFAVILDESERVSALVGAAVPPEALQPLIELATRVTAMVAPTGVVPYTLSIPFYGPVASAEVGSLPAVGLGLAQGLIHGAIAYGVGLMVGKMIGLDDTNSEALGNSAAIGAAAYQLSSAGTPVISSITTLGGTIASWLGSGGLAVIYFVLTYEKTGSKKITFTCRPYEAPNGGADCEKCNNDLLRPCSEYRCKSLGQACQLINKESPGKEKCIWIGDKDTTSPIITPLDVLSPAGLKYVSDTPLGVKIVKGESECLPAFAVLQFGITTNEPSQCRVDTNHTSKFDEMQFYFGESNLYESNHTQLMKALPFSVDIDEEGAPILKNGETTQLFVRCIDANGNGKGVDAKEYAISFCVDPSPDTTPPQIEGTSVVSGNPVKFGTQNISIDVYVNEPSECKWSITDKAYSDMENPMGCETNPLELNALLSYSCTANLSGLKNNAENKFYFRCKDKPSFDESERNVMAQSYEYNLKGTQPLNVVKFGPNETVTSGTSPVTVDLEVETANGADEGKAWCYFSPSGLNDSYVQMLETDSYKHKQTLQLTNGNYNYYFKCTDLGGNSDEGVTTFSVFSDDISPIVTRVYKEENRLKIVTDEDAECVYSLTGCNFVFDEGLKAYYSNANIKTNNYIDWKSNSIHYIKCKDAYGNEPNGAECSVAVKPLESVDVL